MGWHDNTWELDYNKSLYDITTSTEMFHEHQSELLVWWFSNRVFIFWIQISHSTLSTLPTSLRNSETGKTIIPHNETK
jgi:hypothetical protein